MDRADIELRSHTNVRANARPPAARGWSTSWLVVVCLFLLVGMFGAAAATGVVELRVPDDVGLRTSLADTDDSVLASTSRWEYDGAYRYGPYGSEGMRRRASGRDATDPIVPDPRAEPDVFEVFDRSDPAGGAPVGLPPSNMTIPYFDPYAGYANPYANRIRLAYGAGYAGLAASQND